LGKAGSLARHGASGRGATMCGISAFAAMTGSGSQSERGGGGRGRGREEEEKKDMGRM